MADRIIQTETLQSIANALRGGASQSASDKIEVADFAEVASNLKDDSVTLKGVIDKSVTSINIPSGTTKIGASVFRDCTSLTDVTIPGSVTIIDSAAFNGCTSLEEITISNGVTSINSQAFNGCSSLKEVTIPNSVTSIGFRAFQNCSSLATINIPRSVTSIESFVFQNIKSDAVINCGFAQGAVSGAPWGAPSSVTINYNVTN